MLAPAARRCLARVHSGPSAAHLAAKCSSSTDSWAISSSAAPRTASSSGRASSRSSCYRRFPDPAHRSCASVPDWPPDALWDEVAAVLAPMGLCLSVAKTKVCHIDEGFDFLGWRIQRRAWQSQTGECAVYTYPSKKTLASIIEKVRALTRRATHRTLADLLRRLNPVLRGWCNYFRHGVSARTFGYLDHCAFWRIVGWLRKRHLRLNMHTLVRRFLPGWKIRAENIEMFRPTAVAIVRYHYRATRIPTPWSSPTTTAA